MGRSLSSSNLKLIGRLKAGRNVHILLIGALVSLGIAAWEFLRESFWYVISFLLFTIFISFVLSRGLSAVPPPHGMIAPTVGSAPVVDYIHEHRPREKDGCSTSGAFYDRCVNIN